MDPDAARASSPVLPSRFAIVATPDLPLKCQALDRDLAVSPDGRHLAYRAGGGPPTVGSALMVRATDNWTPTAPGHFRAGVFFSPDSRWIGFFTPTELKIML